jgi:hypothetical protein
MRRVDWRQPGPTEGNLAAALRMLTVPIPVARLHERDLLEKQFVEKRLVFIERLKGLFKSSHRLYCFPTHQHAAGRRGLAFR